MNGGFENGVNGVGSHDHENGSHDQETGSHDQENGSHDQEETATENGDHIEGLYKVRECTCTLYK